MYVLKNFGMLFPIVDRLNRHRYTTHVIAVDYSFSMDGLQKQYLKMLFSLVFEMAQLAEKFSNLMLLTRLYQKKSLMESKYLCPDYEKVG